MNTEHFNKLKKGVMAWNDWRNENPDLSRANLTGANLSRADLTGANLSRANLTDADLTDANLSRADLTRAVGKKIYLFSGFGSIGRYTQVNVTDDQIKCGCFFGSLQDFKKQVSDNMNEGRGDYLLLIVLIGEIYKMSRGDL